MKATVQIEIASAGDHSFLRQVFMQPPFKILDITEDKKNNPLHLMLMSSSPGIMDGDEYEIAINIAENAALQLHTQGYQRLFQMKTCATQQLDVRLQAGAFFCFLPHPTVPHYMSSFTGRNNFYLSSHCRFVFGEVLTCGRKLNEEAFVFSKYHSITTLFLNDRLVVKENLLLMPKLIDVHALGQLEGFTHQASLLIVQAEIETTVLQKAISHELTLENNIAFGISSLQIEGIIVRMLGQGAEQLYNCMQRINNMLTTHTQKPAGYAS